MFISVNPTALRQAGEGECYEDFFHMLGNIVADAIPKLTTR